MHLPGFCTYNKCACGLCNLLKDCNTSGYNHALVFEPVDWDTESTGAGFYYFSNKHRYDFSGVNAAAGVGLMFDTGEFIDSKGNIHLYTTVAFAVGEAYTVGSGIALTTSGKAEDFFGYSFGGQASIGNLGGEVFLDIQHGAVNDMYGDKLWGFGVNRGIGAATFLYLGYTFRTKPLPNDNWSNPRNAK